MEKKALVYGYLFYEQPYDVKQCPLLESEQELLLVLMTFTGYLNV